jgi:hypothetical protein
MTQSAVLHTNRAKQFAERFIAGLQAEGYAVPWDPGAGGMIACRDQDFDSSPCVIVLWTRDAVANKWVWEAADAAFKRGALVQVLIDPIESPLADVLPPVDFTQAWDGRPTGPPWRALMERVRAKSGRPIGKLPLKEEAQPLALVAGALLVTVSTLVTGGPFLQPSADELALRQAPAEEAPAVIAMGGPTVSPRELVVARMPHEAPLKTIRVVTMKFEPIAQTNARVAEPGDVVANDDDTLVVRIVDLTDPT